MDEYIFYYVEIIAYTDFNSIMYLFKNESTMNTEISYSVFVFTPTEELSEALIKPLK